MGDRIVNKSDGGPAFPRLISGDRIGFFFPQDGMSLRDYFAAAALPLIDMGEARSNASLARIAYEIADAILEERAK
jgi:hypothetical protein